MNLLELYRNGEHEQAWSDLQALGPTVRQEPDYSLACEVAAETMRRVRRNCERIISRLRASSYIFGLYPDGSRGYYTQGPIVPPTNAMRADSSSLEQQVGPLPISLRAFWQEVGSVDLVGMHPSWPELLDPLVVYPPEAAISDLNIGEGEVNASSQFEAILAPDDLHKDNISGGSPYSVALPDPSADFLLLNERHSLLFVPYLRLAILRWGGFPGLDGRAVEFEPLVALVAGLEPF